MPGGVHTLRTVADAAVLRESFARDRGSRSSRGFIGAEVASTAQALGVEVTLVDMARVPLERVLGAEVGRLLAARFREQGVDLRLGVGLAKFLAGDDGRVAGVELTDGSKVTCDAALVAVGAEPVVDLVGERDGIPTDACWPHRAPRRLRVRRRRVRLATLRISPRARRALDVGGRSGASVAQAILGRERPYDDLPYFWSDQFGLRSSTWATPRRGPRSSWTATTSRSRLATSTTAGSRSRCSSPTGLARRVSPAAS